ncbi:MAG TPA: thioredoxin [bacterium]|nr:thioredoxin [bacterium]
MEQLIDNETKLMLKAMFDRQMKDDVEVKVYTADAAAPAGTGQVDTGEYTRKLVEELAAIEPRIKPLFLKAGDKSAVEAGVKTSPTIFIGYDKGYRIIYNGAPLGYEATGFIETIAIVSSGESGLVKELEDVAAQVKPGTRVQVIVTPSCPYCVKAVVLANRVGVASKGRVISECVEAEENRALAAEYNISSVPTQIINRDIASAVAGAQHERAFVRNILKYGNPAAYETLIKNEEAAKAEAERLVDNPSKPAVLTDKSFDEALKKYSLLIVDFWAEWCAPCRMLAPVIEELALEKQGEMVFGKVNTDENRRVSEKYRIMSIPSLIVFKNGEEAGRITGAMPKNELLAEIKKYI